MRRTRFRKWSWKAQDERSGQTRNAEDLVREWNGRMVSREDAEIRHPQDYARVIPDNTAVPWSRPEQEDNTTPYGIGVWTIGSTFVIPPNGVQPDQNCVEFEYWFNTIWPTPGPWPDFTGLSVWQIGTTFEVGS